jgi:hypothetical protein
MELQAQNARLSADSEKKKKAEEQVKELKQECERMREQVQELQRDNSAQ